MSDLHYCGWRPFVTQTLLGGVLLWNTLSIVYSNDKPPKHKTDPAPAVERTARVERQSPKLDMSHTRQNNGQGASQARIPTTVAPHLNSGRQSSSKFQPEFRHEPQRVKLQPTIVNVPQADSPAKRSQPGPANQLTLLANRHDQQKGKQNNQEKPPKVEKPRVEKPQAEKPKVEKPAPQPKPQIEVKPKVEIPKIEKPAREPKVKTEEKPKVEVPRKPKGPTNNDKGENRTDGQIQIRKAPNQKPNRADKPDTTDNAGSKIRIKKPESSSDRGGVNPATGKVKIKTPQSDEKLNAPLQNAAKNLGKNGNTVDKSVRLQEGATLTREHRERIKQNINQQQDDLVKQGKVPAQVKVKLPTQVKVAGTERLRKVSRDTLKLPVPKNGKLDPSVAAKLKLRPAHEVLDTRLKNGDFQHLSRVKSGQKFQLDKQFQLRRGGDIGRRLNLVASLQLRGGWRHRHFGPISPIYSKHCRSMWYAGPSFCSPYVWYPSWSPWVDWCWWDTCAPLYDPRPIYCQPIVYNPCVPWVAWEFPVWQPLPYATCGTWVDVEPVVINEGIDLQLLATRFVDPGHADQELGPRFRVWIRNNSPYDLHQAFNVLLIASTDANAYAGLPEAGVRVLGLRAGETQAIDIRLPYAASTLGRDSSGNAIPFTHLTALVDSHNELPEAFEANNGATLLRGDILPVDPAAFAADPSSAQPNGIIHVAGEGLGPEPGQAMVVIGDQEFQAEILGWFDLGVQIRLPDFDLDSPTAADLVIIRGDGAASNPLTIEIDPNSVEPEGLVEYGPQLPDPPPLPEPRF